MSIRKAVYDVLDSTAWGVYPIVAPQENTGKYIVFFVRREVLRTQDGVAVEDITLTINIYANDLSDCIELADIYRSAIEGASGTYDVETMIIGLFQSESDDYIENLDKYMITQDYLLRFN